MDANMMSRISEQNPMYQGQHLRQRSSDKKASPKFNQPGLEEKLKGAEIDLVTNFNSNL
jgi:hypothetical protein